MKVKDNLSLVLHGINDLRLEQTPLPDDPEPNEVQLSTHTVGICGSDLHFLTHGQCEGWVVKEPMISGHESSATVVAVGQSVQHLKVGDRVAVEPGVVCLKCDFCRGGRCNLCRDVVMQSCPPFDGSLRRLYNHNSVFCHKLPDNVSPGEGALIEPLAVAVYACHRLNICKELNQKILVTGAGPVGLLCALVAKANGAQDICILDINNSRLELAQSLGFNKTLRVSREEETQTVVQNIRKLFGDLVDITLECTGVESCLNIAIRGTKEGGKVGLIGLNHKKVNVCLSSAGFNELELIGIRRYVNKSEAIDMISNARIDVKPLISHVFKLEDGIQAFETAKTCADGVIKVHIVCQ